MFTTIALPKTYATLSSSSYRQQRVNSIERALLNVQLLLKQSLTTLPGRNLGIFAEGFSTPLLPSVQPTPNNPLVPWLNSITSVNVSLVRGMPATQGTESLTRKTNLFHQDLSRSNKEEKVRSNEYVQTKNRKSLAFC